MSSTLAIEAHDVAHAYGAREALRGVDFVVPAGTVHGFLGPNGSGKSTLFRLLATILPLRAGRVQMLGIDLATAAARVRERIGVVFQSPALDRKLTVRDNLRYGGHLQGLSGAALEARIDAMLEAGALADRARDRVGELSGGLRRRVEIAKGLLHRPGVVLLDEPSTGLDPVARQELWRFLRAQEGLTVLFTTHLMAEAEDADHLTIVDAGRVVADGAPDTLRAALGGEILEIGCAEPARLAADVEARFGVAGRVFPSLVRLELERAHELVARLVDAFGARIHRISVARPSLEDVFIARTGHRFDAEDG